MMIAELRPENDEKLSEAKAKIVDLEKSKD